MEQVGWKSVVRHPQSCLQAGGLDTESVSSIWMEREGQGNRVGPRKKTRVAMQLPNTFQALRVLALNLYFWMMKPLERIPITAPPALESPPRLPEDEADFLKWYSKYLGMNVPNPRNPKRK